MALVRAALAAMVLLSFIGIKIMVYAIIYIIAYMYRGKTLTYVPYFLIRLKSPFVRIQKREEMIEKTEKKLKAEGWKNTNKFYIAYPLMALILLNVFNTPWWFLPIAYGLVILAYQPSPDMFNQVRIDHEWRKGMWANIPAKLYDFTTEAVDSLFVRKIDSLGNVDKFYGRNMMIRHLWSGTILAIAFLYFSWLSLLLIPVHCVGAAGYKKRDNLGFSEGVLGLTITIGLLAIYYLRGQYGS